MGEFFSANVELTGRCGAQRNSGQVERVVSLQIDIKAPLLELLDNLHYYEE